MVVISLVSVSSLSLEMKVWPSGEELDAVILVKNSRFVMRRGRRHVEHALESDTISHIV